MLLALRGLLVIAACHVTAATPTPIRTATYDQKQTGDLNVQIALKDLRIVALHNSELLDDYTDYDYFYDYADFTIKPEGVKPDEPVLLGSTHNCGPGRHHDSAGVCQDDEPESTNSTFYDDIDSTKHNTTLPNDEEIPNVPSTMEQNITGVSEPLSLSNSTISTFSGNINSTEHNTTLPNDEEIPNVPSTMEKNITGVSQLLSLSNSTISTFSGNINSTERNITLPNDEKIPNANSSNSIMNLTSNNDKSQPNKEKGEATASSIRKSVLRSQKRCKSGYIPNGNGRCRRTSRPWLSLLPEMDPPIIQIPCTGSRDESQAR
ncbi:uncharacterized protein [Anoplolepis gracilipes]|uniref:uncharacterized protein isoform X2 n=1 Tax=Anoplolepis gracilipes TaxID=354296 RepID=UPI003BA1C310